MRGKEHVKVNIHARKNPILSPFPHTNSHTRQGRPPPHTNSHLVGPVPGASELTRKRRSDAYNDLCAASEGGEVRSCQIRMTTCAQQGREGGREGTAHGVQEGPAVVLNRQVLHG